MRTFVHLLLLSSLTANAVQFQAPCAFLLNPQSPTQTVQTIEKAHPIWPHVTGGTLVVISMFAAIIAIDFITSEYGPINVGRGTLAGNFFTAAIYWTLLHTDCAGPLGHYSSRPAKNSETIFWNHRINPQWFAMNLETALGVPSHPTTFIDFAGQGIKTGTIETEFSSKRLIAGIVGTSAIATANSYLLTELWGLSGYQEANQKYFIEPANKPYLRPRQTELAERTDNLIVAALVIGMGTVLWFRKLMPFIKDIRLKDADSQKMIPMENLTHTREILAFRNYIGRFLGTGRGNVLLSGSGNILGGTLPSEFSRNAYSFNPNLDTLVDVLENPEKYFDFFAEAGFFRTSYKKVEGPKLFEGKQETSLEKLKAAYMEPNPLVHSIAYFGLRSHYHATQDRELGDFFISVMNNKLISEKIRRDSAVILMEEDNDINANKNDTGRNFTLLLASSGMKSAIADLKEWYDRQGSKLGIVWAQEEIEILRKIRFLERN